MRFAELTPGRVLHAGPARLTEDEITAYARAWDPQWFHVDAARAADGPWQGLIASGWQTCGVAMRLACDEVLAGSASIGSPGLAYLKWENPVRPGDALMLRVDVLETRVAKSNPALGIMRWRWRMSNQRGEQVLDLEATSLFDLSVTAA
jgi:acyl dehydratase